ncbi:hypothetical protein CDL15_Pgr020907 [Punica granatum]|uniref:Uncharacterized protein n=1 Tax=Punica granatum TaxID=22663 RepID=A0A218XVG1_PUNGR|nr:hypothetical protein CDL15_Pgr020907 [Punica granatum]
MGIRTSRKLGNSPREVEGVATVARDQVWLQNEQPADARGTARSSSGSDCSGLWSLEVGRATMQL